MAKNVKHSCSLQQVVIVHPRLTVNTCVHYLKLPDYPTEENLRERLLSATKERGFHLN